MINTRAKTITLDIKDLEYVEQNHINASRLMRTAINDLRENKNFETYQQEIKVLNQRVDKFLEKLGKYSEFLEKKGLREEFYQEVK